jgi:hypothetical protein
MLLFCAASYRDLLGRMGIHGARSKAAFRRTLDERARESPGEPGLGSGCSSSLLRKNQCLAQQLAGFRISAAGLESLVEITGGSDRQSAEETNEHGVGLDDFIRCVIGNHGQSPRTRTIGRLRIQPEMQQATRTSVMRCLQKRKGATSPGTGTMPPHGDESSGDDFERRLALLCRTGVDPIPALTGRKVVRPPVGPALGYRRGRDRRFGLLAVTGNQPAFFPALFVLTRMPSWHHGMESRHGDDDQEVAGEARRGAVAGPAVAL